MPKRKIGNFYLILLIFFSYSCK